MVKVKGYESLPYTKQPLRIPRPAKSPVERLELDQAETGCQQDSGRNDGLANQRKKVLKRG